MEREGRGAVGGFRILPRGHLEFYQTACLELYQPAQEIPFKLYRRVHKELVRTVGSDQSSPIDFAHYLTNNTERFGSSALSCRFCKR